MELTMAGQRKIKCYAGNGFEGVNIANGKIGLREAYL